MLHQCHKRVANQVGCGLVASVEGEHAVLQQLSFAQRFTANFIAYQSRQHIAFRIARFFSACPLPMFLDKR